MDEDWEILSIKCAAHTLQLCIKDACEENEVEDLIKNIKQIAVELRKSSYRSQFKDHKNRVPPLNCITRWSSLFQMVSAIADQEEFIKLILEQNRATSTLHILNTHSQAIREMRILFKIISDSTNSLQNEHLTMGDLYKIWLELEIDVEELSLNNETVSYMKVAIVESMNIRKENLFTNELFLSCLYLDPRFNYLNSRFLTDENKFKARVSVVLDNFQILTSLILINNYNFIVSSMCFVF